MSPAFVISPVVERLALKYQPVMAPPAINTAKISQPTGIRRQRGVAAGAAAP